MTPLILGAVHKVRHAIFGQFLPLSHLSHFVTHPGTLQSESHISDPPLILEGLIQKTRTKAPFYKFQLFAWVFVRGLCQEVFCLEGFVRSGFCPFPFCQNTSVTTES